MNQRGNAFVYVLIAIILFAGLMFTIARMDEGGTSTSDLDEGRAKVGANSILAYASSVEGAVIRLDRVGTSADQIDFMLPSDGSFNTAPNLNKLFHPEGGGVNYKPLPPDVIGEPPGMSEPVNGYYVGRFMNVDWTPTTANDVIFTAFGITKAACEVINKQITGSTTIPAMTNPHRILVDTTYHSLPNQGMTIARCAGCEEKPSLCVVSSTDPNRYAYYSVIAAQ